MVILCFTCVSLTSYRVTLFVTCYIFHGILSVDLIYSTENLRPEIIVVTLFLCLLANTIRFAPCSQIALILGLVLFTLALSLSVSAFCIAFQF